MQSPLTGSMSCSPSELADTIKNLSLDDAHSLWRRAGSELTPQHAAELLSLASGLSEWHKIMAVLMIGNFYFDNEFVDYAIDMLTFAPTGSPSRKELWSLLVRGEDPYAVGLWACNLLMSRKAIRRQQYQRIAHLPDDAFGKQTLLEGLRTRIA